MAAKKKIGPKKIVNKMKLGDAIHAVEADYPGTIFYVGSESSYFFIGTAEEFDNDIAEINKMYKARFKVDRKRVLTNFVEGLYYNVRVYSNYKTNKKDEDALCDYIHNNMERIGKNLTLVSKYHGAINGWRDIQDRIVRKCYKRDPSSEFDVPNGLVMIVNGCEQGKWCLYREYQRKTVQSDNKCGWYGDNKEDNE